MVDLEGSHVKKAVEKVDPALESDGVEASFVFEVVLVGLGGLDSLAVE